VTRGVAQAASTAPSGPARRARRWWDAGWPAAATAVVFYASARLGYALTLPGTNVGAFWPPSGLSIGLLLVWGTRAWPGVAVGATALLLPDLLSRLPLAAALVTGFGEIAADVVPPLVGAWAVRRSLGGADPLASARNLFKLVAWTGLAAQALAATMGVAALWAGGVVVGPALWSVWLDWFISALASVALLMPLCLAWGRPWPPERPLRHLLALGVALGCGLVVFVWVEPALAASIRYLGFLVVIWAAFALGARATTLAAVTLATIAIWATVLGRGAFIAGPVAEQVLLLNVYLGTLGITGLVLAAVLAERQAGATRLREGEARLRAILESVPTPIAMSGSGGQIEFVNRRFVAFFGWRPADLPDVATWFLRAYPEPAYRARMAEAWARATAEAARTLGDASVPGVEVTCKDGSVRTVDVIGTASGERMVVLFVDLTERRQAEARDRALRDQLAQAQRIESIGRLAGGVAHDLNNLLSPIISYTHLLLEGAAPTSPEAADLGEIKHASERARDLTRQLLALGRKQVLDVQTLDLRQELVRFEKLLRLAIREDVRLVLRVPPTLGLVRADPGQIEQVVMNLAVNAQQAMPGGGILTLELADVVVGEEEARSSPGARPGAWVRLSVSDTGTGMEPAVLERIFEPFFTTRQRGEGTGLGLSIVHGIVSQHGGQVVAASTPGRGSTFRVDLPRAREASPAHLPEPPPAQAPAPGPRATGTILLAEDEDGVRRVAVRVLERLGYRVLAARNAAACLALAAGEPGPIDLLLTDVVMPGLDGRQLHQQLGALRPGLRVLFMSGYAGDVVTHHGVLEDGAAFLQKPFSPEGLAAAVQRALAA
jgi:PAS domain S-box-containing protein